MREEIWDAEATIRGVMQPGETLLWLGRPTRPARPAQGPSIGLPEAFLLAVLGVVGLLVFNRLMDDRPLGLADLQAGSAILMLGAYFGAPWLTARPRVLSRRRIAYAVTDRRALVLELSRRGVRLDAHGPAQIAYVREHVRGDGLRDVVFRQGPVNPRTLPVNPVGFLGITDAAGAVKALTALRASQQRTVPVVGVSPA